MPESRQALRRTALLGLGAMAISSLMSSGLASTPPPTASAATRSSTVPTAHPGKATTARPNILYIVTDDETVRDMSPRTMPNVYRYLVGAGTRYTSSVTSYAFCCPSRASFQTGEYTHNHGVISCDSQSGFHYFMTHRKKGDTLPEWLRAAGYSTGFTGKYINGNEYNAAPIPRGWTDWHGFSRGTYNYLRQNEVSSVAGGPRKIIKHHTYTTATTGNITSAMITTMTKRNRPWFAEAAFVAPHEGADSQERDNPKIIDTPGVAKQYRNTFHGRPMPKTPAYNEKDVSDKSHVIRGWPLLSRNLQRQQQEGWEQRQEALRSVDAQVARLIRQLKAGHQLARTVVIFTSDNGFDLGEHRHVQGKQMPYETDTSVPLVIRGPGFPAHANRAVPVQTLDVTPTIAQLAHARIPASVDGMSILPSRKDSSWQMDRAVFLRQYRGPIRYIGVRTARYLYVQVGDGTVELYDHHTDPYEVSSVARSPKYAAVRAALAKATKKLVGCKGKACDVTTNADSLLP